MFRNAILRRLSSVIVLMILGLHCGSAGAADAQTLRAGDIATVLFPLVTFGGGTYGVPALAMATAISYIRAREDKHHWRDVIAGGALGYGVAMITVTPIEATQIAPIIGPQANRRLP
jgi:hypothetical protein